ncbi:type II toxin-antitoxin system Phd/YefM family antitoxin [Macrococcus capreoli]|uniref:type II toxin-antitoxin system Phd/YefM family antitoxin n=1 Tax=Macrococcus capreoli TaxID=2982690 RepID=UPI0021D5D0F9|nr:type II toxin-antitoxin system Phd/YefM family antitoxin [Macrococcus sp. TMW 2.2395]MCU7558475.1 type II toxin-antitoxin system Phd/YefM family antitoxin [Macrococcus sp. TMW 2.2395]
MKVTTYSNARSNFRNIIDIVNEDCEPYTITTNTHNAVIISESDYNSMIETLYLQNSPTNAERLQRAVNDTKNKKNIIEVEIDLDE